jgi:Protein of unknown function (DUF3455)
VVPGAIEVPVCNKVFLIGHGVGVQIYSCNGTVWGFVAPRANLPDEHGKLIITHFGGPTWRAKDGSTVVGHVEASITVDPTVIPWLRLSAASTTPAGSRTRPTSNESQPPVASPHPRRNATRQRQAPWSRSHAPYFWKRTGA